MKKLNLDVIRIDGNTQPRLEINQDTVRDYAEHMREGAVFPPVTVFFDGAEYWLADGFHRWHATKSNGLVSLECEVISGSLDDAFLYSRAANKSRGLTMSHADNRNIVISMLKHEVYGQWSNNKIAEHVGVTSMTVGRIKLALQQPEEKQVKYIDKHGTETISNIKKQKNNKEDNTVTPAEKVYDPAEDEAKEIQHTIKSLQEENTKLRDVIAIGAWDATEIEKLDAEQTIAELRERIRVLEIDNKSLRESRDTYQNQNSDLMKTVATLQKKLKKFIE